MKTLFIDQTDLPPNSQFICDNSGKLDLVGWIITELGTLVPRGTRTPQQLSKAVDPLSCFLRHTIVLTPIGYRLLAVTTLPPSQQIAAANKLLNPLAINILSPVRRPAQDQPPYDSMGTIQQVEDCLGMPVPPEFQDTLKHGIALKLDAITISDMICDLM